MSNIVMRETTPLTANDCFMIFSRVKNNFNFPLHYHEEFELNLILNAAGAKRIVGGSIEEISELELVFVGSNLYHTWYTHNCTSKKITEVTIQFHKDLFDDKFLQRNQLSFIKTLLERSQLGISFSQETITALKDRLLSLDKKTGFDSVLELISILHVLSVSPNMKLLSDAGFSAQKLHYNSRRIEKAFAYMSANYHSQVTLAEVARIANMPEASFSRFIKKRTGKTFVDSLTEIRLGHASRMLIETTNTIAEIAYRCGFNNISNFNRIFKRKKACVPKEFRETYNGNRIFI
ncbi:MULTISPECIES: AraC family transcriptional regulator [unclassified Mucilaginibacter]|uniref:AraC family transcriptional regulator n=1 Tax=unclassified Mucilaginibacter TaxID=2617802 RepID=UPI002AC8AD57|nr:MULTISPECIES: AraC family transcriptional regulator [unclassified Mucilaginibacter]MEB0260097.1 AraC family transcriptional regulator [Mucilaginibacter sp. 10I4]MEB0279181.1 AraC family transcriptional regulator [Mucilaginibacter sp. 10B2]MEB0301965.1 AraC family transcriptional regulator [Mucilaginibacter sp. 5C4]WPX22360.1 AraC family transcriptional regulator [Mucilaginibacter sp. 5C4]